MFRRFEQESEGSRRFWELELRGSAVSSRWGKVGGKGRTLDKAYGTTVEALTAFDAKIAKLLAEGWVDPGDPLEWTRAHVRSARPIEPVGGEPLEIADLGLGLDLPDHVAPLALLHGNPELGLPPDRALALLMERRWVSWQFELPRDLRVRVRIAREGEGIATAKDAPFVVVELPAAGRVPAIFCQRLGGGIHDDKPPRYGRYTAPRSLLDCDVEKLEWHPCADEAREADTVGELLAPVLGGMALDEAFRLHEDLVGCSRFGGLPTLGAYMQRLPPGRWRYALHLSTWWLDLTFGDAGSLHLWLGEGEVAGQALLVPDSA